MLNIFKRNKTKKQGNDSTVNANELLNSEFEEGRESEVETELSLSPSWNLPEEDIYVYRFMNNDLRPLRPNQISLSGIELQKIDNQVAVSAFVRSSLNKKVKFEKTKLLLMMEDGTKLARKEFDLSELGELPENSSRPWGFVFDEKDIIVPVDDIPAEGWTLAFELQDSAQKHSLDLADSWQKSLATEDVDKLKELTDSLNPPKPGEVNFLGLQAQLAEDGNLHVTLLIRNGNTKNITLEKLPLEIIDASGEVVARGGFTLDQFEIKANTSKPWTFIFPKAMVTKENIDLSTWKAYPIQEK